VAPAPRPQRPDLGDRLAPRPNRPLESSLGRNGGCLIATRRNQGGKVRKPKRPRLLDLINTSLDDDQAIDPVVIDLRKKSSIADAMVVASGRSERHVKSMADHLIERLGNGGWRARAEGLAKGEWVLVDAGDVVIHLFKPDVRNFYNLEKMWAVELDAPASGAVRAAS
jgi:ribosome-associated protein